MRNLFAACAAAALAAAVGGAAHAATPITYYYNFGSTPTNTAGYTMFDPTASGGATITAANGESFLIQMSGTGTSTLANYFGTNALTVSSSGAGSNTLTLVAFESGLTAPAQKATVAYQNNGNSTATVLESFDLINNAATTFVGSTPTVVSSTTLAPGGSSTLSTNFGPTAATYGLAESYSAVYAPGSNVNATITSVVSAAPEPGTWALMLGGVAMLGLMLRGRLVRRRDETTSFTAA